MISFFAILLIILVLLLALMQTVLVICYRWFFRDAPQLSCDENSFPKAAIILCLRGFEEATPDCLAELIGQNYPDFELHIAFDSRLDPAVQQVEEFFEGHGSNARLHFFDPLPDCSYKCSGIVHVLNHLNENFGVVAFCDGDAVVDINWLRELVTPMMINTEIGATTGNRWFAPVETTTGALVRKHWNAAAIVQMQAYDIAWGGSMAVRRSAIDKCGLIELWSKSFCEDTPLTTALQNNGLTLYRVPNLIVENHEPSSLAECYRWIARQLVTVRLHHQGWPLVMAHGLATGVATCVTPLVAILLFATGFFIAGRSVFVAWLVYQIINFVLLMLIEHCNQSAMAERETSGIYNPRHRPSLEKNLWSLAVVQLLHPLAVIRALRMETIQWRGVSYQIDDGQITVANRRRIAANPDSAAEQASSAHEQIRQ